MAERRQKMIRATRISTPPQTYKQIKIWLSEPQTPRTTEAAIMKMAAMMRQMIRYLTLNAQRSFWLRRIIARLKSSEKNISNNQLWAIKSNNYGRIFIRFFIQPSNQVFFQQDQTLDLYRSIASISEKFFTISPSPEPALHIGQFGNLLSQSLIEASSKVCPQLLRRTGDSITAKQVVAYFEKSGKQCKKEAPFLDSLLSSLKPCPHSLNSKVALEMKQLNLLNSPFLRSLRPLYEVNYICFPMQLKNCWVAKLEAVEDGVHILLCAVCATRHAIHRATHDVSLAIQAHPHLQAALALSHTHAVMGVRDGHDVRDGRDAFDGAYHGFPILRCSSRQEQIFTIKIAFAQSHGIITQQMIRIAAHTRLTLLLKISALQSNLNKRPNLYSLLGVKPGAKSEQIRYNYFKLMSKYRPDGVAPNQEQNHSKLLNEAYAILSNDKLRAKYDNQNGFSKAIQQEETAKKKPLSKDDEIDKDYSQAKKGFSAVLGDKETRFRERLMAVGAVGILAATLFILFYGKTYKKAVIARSLKDKQAS